MFYWLLYPLRDSVSLFNLFGYITFRAAGATFTALIIAFVLGPPVIRFLRRHQIGQTVRDDGPATHLSKQGTPTMGGLLILMSVLVPVLLWGRLDSRSLLVVLVTTFWMTTSRLSEAVRRGWWAGTSLSVNSCWASESVHGSASVLLSPVILLLLLP